MGVFSSRNSIRRLFGIGIAGVQVLVLLAVLIVPSCALFNAARSLLDVTASASTGPLFNLGRWGVLLANTVIVAGVAMTTATLLGLIVGLLIARTDLPGRGLIAGAAVLGACVPVYVSIVFIFSAIPIWQYANSAWVCGLFYGLLCAPLAVIVLAATFRAADPDLEDQARLETSDANILLHVVIPQARWGIAALGVIVILLVATDFTITDILLVRTFAEEVYTQYALDRSPGAPVFAAMPLFLVLAAMLIMIQRRYRLLGEHSHWRFGTPPRRISLGRWRWPATLLCLVAALAIVGPPTIALLRRVGSFEEFFTAAGGLWRELAVSAAGAAAGATIIVLAAVGPAWAALRTTRRRWAVWIGVAVLLAMPTPVIGIALVELLNRPGILGNIYDLPTAVVVGYVVRFLPFAVLLLIPAVQRVPREHEWSARLDGCDWLAVQRHVYWPAITTHAAVVWLIIAILCFGEVGTTVLLAPPGWAPASVRAFTLIHFGVYGDLATLAITTLACILLPWLILVLLLRIRFIPREAKWRGYTNSG